jgi:hypothetical protein
VTTADLLSALAAEAVTAVDKSKVTPGVLGFLVVALLGVATWLLIRSMNRQLRKVDFEERANPDDSDPDGPTPRR